MERETIKKNIEKEMKKVNTVLDKCRYGYKALAKYYDEFYNKKEYTKKLSFKTILGNNQTVLDVGCGGGIHMSL